MPSNIVSFKNLYDTYNSMQLPVTGIGTSSNFTINNLKGLHPELPFKSIGFRPEYFSFLFVKNAKGKYTTDDVSFNSVPGTIYFTNPGHFKSFEWQAIEDVTLITFTESFLKENVHREIFREFPFLLAETVQPKVLQPQAFAEFETLYQQIYKEYNGQSAYKGKIIGGQHGKCVLHITETIPPDADIHVKVMSDQPTSFISGWKNNYLCI